MKTLIFKNLKYVYSMNNELNLKDDNKIYKFKINKQLSNLIKFNKAYIKKTKDKLEYIVVAHKTKDGYLILDKLIEIDYYYDEITSHAYNNIFVYGGSEND